VEPTAEPLPLPQGYGTATSLIPWSEVRARLEASENYWVATVRPDGRPHVVPRWGVWLDESWYYDGSPETRHVRNLEHNASAVLHLEDGMEAVVLEGTSHPVTPEGDLGKRLASAFVKYHDHGYAPKPDQWDAGGGLRRFRPVSGYAWFQFPSDATRYAFPPEE
jgi:hypothetical protein